LLFFQLPSSLPLPKRTQSVEEPNTGSEENAEPGSATSEVTRGQKRPSSFQGSKIKDLPGGLMGKILTYKSGNVKMKIGDALLDVSIGPVACCVLCEHIVHSAIIKINILCRSLLGQIVCLYRTLRRLTLEKNTAAPWERSVSAPL
jgi:hypothetical protein